jgi:hypothetical protein
MRKEVRTRKEEKTLTKYYRDLDANPWLLLGLGHTKSKNINDDKYESQHD